MKYELIGKNDYFLNPIETILKNRGIEDIQSFLNISEKDVIHWSLLRNIVRAAECLLEHVKKGSYIFVQYDSDIDGICSSTMIIKYLKKVFPDIKLQWRIHNGKEHGVIVNEVPDDVDLVIIPDAGSNQYREHKQLKDKGIDVIVLDHHDCEKESDYAIVVNNQLSPDYLNKNFSGAGIVFKFLQALDDKLQINHANHYLDLVAVGNIGDMMDSRELETRYYMSEGLKKINNKFLQALFDKQEFSTKGVVNLINTAFYIAPLCNAAIRVGSHEEKMQMINAFLESDEKIYYKRKDIYEDIQTNTARLLANIRARQNRLRDKGVEAINERIEEKNLLQNKILIINVTDLLDKNLTGLVANQLSRLYKRPVLLIRQKDDSTVFGGSARGYEKGFIKDLKGFLLDTDKFIFCEGHKSAFGIEIEGENLINVNEIVNEKLSEIDINMDIHEVDFIIPGKQLADSIIKDIHDLRDYWGQRVEEPLLAFSGIEVNKEDLMLLGSNRATLKFTFRGIEFIKFKFNENEFNDLFSNNGTFVIDLVGRCGLNIWEGKEKAQVIIEDFEVIKVKKKQWVF
ncbi:DHH family phosphoesterase [uncultured Metabacillus sp.]|uniref:DHH family phosphoesterase n=1 Tax=uncultured Metabacillus sp. TaxID=2860135 RepID=UPI002629F39D|nr:DHH family phosphoesterase [uncultured Metabacillus sp.]